MQLMIDPPAAPFVLLDEYSLADAARITGWTESAVRTWMTNGQLAGDEWRRIEDANGPGRYGFVIRREAIERVAARKGRPCTWSQARAGQVHQEIADYITRLERELAALRVQRERREILNEARAQSRPATPTAKRTRYLATPAVEIGLAATGPMPKQLQTVSSFARRHGFDVKTETIWRKAMESGAFQVIEGDWSRGGGRHTHHALDADGRRSFVEWGHSGRTKYFQLCGDPECECAAVDFPTVVPVLHEQFVGAGQ